MDWREEAARGLPEPRNDEPPNLRQDIVDELADHLHCALGRELTKNITANEAIQNVKRRFGDPRRVARQLWFDAMKETIMSQRLTLGAVAVLACTCILVTAFAWMTMRSNLQATEAMRTMNAALIEKLAAVRKPAPTAQGGSPDWVPVQFRLVGDTPEKAPVSGFIGYLSHGDSSLERTSNKDGVLDFGSLPAGFYSLKLASPWHEESWRQVLVPPGASFSPRILCPAAEWPKADVSFAIDGLEQLKHREALVLCEVVADLDRNFDGSSWAHPYNTGPTRGLFNIALDLAGHIVYFDEAGWTPSRTAVEQALGPDANSDISHVIRPRLQTSSFERLSHRLGRPVARSFHETRYRLSKIAIVLSTEIRRAAKPQLLNEYQTSVTPCVAWDFTEAAGAAKEDEPYSCRPVAGRKTVWKIPLPAEFLNDLDRMLVSAADPVPEAMNAAESQTDSSIGASLRKALGMQTSVVSTKDPFGLQIQLVSGGLPAARAGLKSGDVLRSVEGWKVTNDRELGWVRRQSAGRKSLRFRFDRLPERFRVGPLPEKFRVDRLTEKSGIVQIPLPSAALTPPTGPSPTNARKQPGRRHGFALLDRRAVPIISASAATPGR